MRSMHDIKVNSLSHRMAAPSRRDFFSKVSDGLYGAALASLLGADLFSSNPALAATGRETPSDVTPRMPHFEPSAKSVIQLFMHGGPSQVDLFDHKPLLTKYAGQPPGRDLANDVLFADEAGGFMPSPFKFVRYGESGLEMADVMPYLGEQADELALIRSTFTTNFTHGPGIFLMQSGSVFPGRPTIGAWSVYGLGSENQDLPAYVVLDDPIGLPTQGIKNWESGWLPPIFQGTRLRSEGSPILNLEAKDEFPTPVRDLARDLLSRLSAKHRDQRPFQPDLDARIASYELAARLQLSATDALDVSQESEDTREMYGINKKVSASYGRRCLMARRLIERGVRYVQIYIEQQIWDNHSGLEKNLRQCCNKTDQPIGGLIKDLRQRGLLDSTLLVWGGEFGRLPLSQGGDGRDHGPAGFTTWMAGGGIKGGIAYGNTDDTGYKAVENRVSVHDFHATILHSLGLDFKKLIYNHNGLDEKPTGQEPARVVTEILA